MNKNNHLPAVTVVVSVYNKARTVAKCISSILEIDYPLKETLIIEGYSSDGSYEILKQFEDKARIVRIQGNYATALNRALELVSTPLVALTDADCTVDKGWLRELAEGFAEEEGVVAVAGYVGTGQGITLLATLIGIEFEERYRRFPRYLLRSPTMNLCVRTEAARQIGFDQHLPVAIETDFGYRLTKLGKILYQPSAVVLHYPRTTWNGFFMQQVAFARGAFMVYRMHKDKLKGDHISTFSMIWQVPLFCLACLFLFMGLLDCTCGAISLVLFAALFLIYARDMARLPIRKKHYPMMAAILCMRTVGWAAGAISGLATPMAQWMRKT